MIVMVQELELLKVGGRRKSKLLDEGPLGGCSSVTLSQKEYEHL